MDSSEGQFSLDTGTENDAYDTSAWKGELTSVKEGYTIYAAVDNELTSKTDGFYESYTPVSYTHLDVYKRQGCIRGRVYTEKNGWLPYITFRSEYDIADTENGVLGDGSPCLLYTSRCV